MYRFALIGQTSSGKTCYMATLALSAAHSGGLTAQLKRDLTAGARDEARSTNGAGESAGGSFVDDVVAERNGVAWITNARQALTRGELPAPNDPDRYLVDFLVGSDSRGMTQIRMVDYAGEFINQDRDPNEDRAALFRHLQDCDGLLIVAEVLPDHADAEERRIVVDRIDKVAEVFGSLHESCKGHLGTAIAVVLTKWDRHSDIDFVHPEQENDKVRRYLDESPVHQNLVNRVKPFLVDQVDTATDLPVGIQFGNCAVFPASAFGRSVRNEQGQYRPDIEARQPFGLIEPLLWLASRFEELRAAEIEAQWQATAAAGVRPFASSRIARESSELLATVPRKCGVAGRLAQVRSAARQAAVMGWLFWIVLAGGLADLGRYAWRAAEWNRGLAVVANPASQDADLKAARGFFSSFDETPWPGLLSMIPALRMDGKAEVERLDSRLLAMAEKRLTEAEATGDDAAIDVAARDYLEQFPSGPRAQDCEQKIEEIDLARRRAAVDRFISINTPKLSWVMSIAAIDAMKSDYETVCSGAPALDGQSMSRRREFEVLLARRKQKLIDSKRQGELRQGVAAAVSRGDFMQAAGLLADHSVKDDFWDKTVGSFVALLPERVERRLRTLVRDENFDTAMSAADDALRGLKDLETAIPADRQATRTAVVDAQPLLAEVRRSAVEEPYDRYLYRAVVDSKTKANCDAYINRAPVGGMKFSVQDYRSYLDECDRGADIRVTPWIRWGKLPFDVTPNHEIGWELWANGSKVAGEGQIVREDPTGEEEPLERGVRMRAEGFNRSISIKLKFWENDMFTARDEIGEFEGRITPAEMRSGKEFTVKGGILESPHTLWFDNLLGYRSEPALPPWRP